MFDVSLYVDNTYVICGFRSMMTHVLQSAGCSRILSLFIIIYIYIYHCTSHTS